MKISLAWIEELLGAKLDRSPEEIAEALAGLGFEVEAITHYKQPQGVVVAEVLEVEKHPNADKLRLAKVTDGTAPTTVVCGAPNLERGQKVFWAKVGAVLADGTVLKETPIRGIKSPGMLCSSRELGVGDGHAGLWALPETLQPGQALEDVVKLEDTILDVTLTPNRPDGLSQIGIARELAVRFNLKSPNIHIPLHADTHSGAFYPVEIQHPDCSRYIARKLEGVNIAPSPLGLEARLIRCGVRPTSNIVDITNLVLLELGQPLHAFDADKLEGGKIIVRKAQHGEKMLALDGKTYSLNPDILMIADAKKPVAIAGIMGGEETAVSASTKNILIESAIFSTQTIRATRKKLNLSSESSYRFERGVSGWSCSTGSARAEAMVSQFTKARTTAFSDQAAKAKDAPIVFVRPSRVERILGEKIPLAEIQSIFQKLGIVIQSVSEEKLSVQPAEWRLDLNQEIDYIEEIARIRGYDKTPSRGSRANLPESTHHLESHELKQKLRAALQSNGFFETLNYGLVSVKAAKFFLDDALSIKLENPLSEDQSVLRPSLIPELFKNMKTNLSYQKKNLKLFEIGSVAYKFNGEPPKNSLLAGVATGNVTDASWQVKEPHKSDFFWMKGVVENLLKRNRVDAHLTPAKSPKSPVRYGGNDEAPYIADFSAFLHPSYSYWIEPLRNNEGKMGYFGKVHPKIAKAFDIPEETFLFEMDTTPFERSHRKNFQKAAAPNRNPVVSRDCSIWVGDDVAWKDLESEILRKNNEGIRTECKLFDLYRDPAKPKLNSFAFTLTFSHPEKTLDDATANNSRDKILENLNKKFKAELRSK